MVAVHSPLRWCLPKADSLCYSQKAGVSESRAPLRVFIPPCGVLRRVVSLLLVALLGCAKWPLYYPFLFLDNRL
jgi:hypothetical protein